MVDPTEALPTADDADVFVDGQYKTSEIIIDTDTGRKRWVLCARELSWEEQSAISDRHTKTIQSERGQKERRVVDMTAVLRDMLMLMVDGTRCVPPLDKTKIRMLKGARLKAFADHYKLTDEANAEEAEEAGES